MDEVENDEEGIAEMLMDDNAIATISRPGTSLKKPPTAVAGGPSAAMRYASLLLYQSTVILRYYLYNVQCTKNLSVCKYLSLKISKSYRTLVIPINNLDIRKLDERLLFHTKASK